MTQAPIVPLAALREKSILFALFLARVILREWLGPARIAGALPILAGVVTLHLG
jgi:drug/metabolite transporter (DMT)-like permease